MKARWEGRSLAVTHPQNNRKTYGILSASGLVWALDGAGWKPARAGAGFHGPGLANAYTNAAGQSVGERGIARPICALREPKGTNAPVRCTQLGTAGRTRGLGLSAIEGCGRFHASDRLAEPTRRRTGCVWRSSQLGPIATDPQSPRRSDGCNPCPDKTRSTHRNGAQLRAPLCEHALCQCLLPAMDSFGAPSAYRHYGLRD